MSVEVPENDLVLPRTGWSPRHARIVRDGERTWLEDLGSLNGSFVGTDRVDGRVPPSTGARSSRSVGPA
jgi:pSer/pThr/pTyr-binding forkhead associated (FHA) protein